ncbi:hypothetical protein M8J76_013560 [Diaphorina citri]|nr:hypothetical protein M8J76_013560 [Diaphorina citri]
MVISKFVTIEISYSTEEPHYLLLLTVSTNRNDSGNTFQLEHKETSVLDSKDADTQNELINVFEDFILNVTKQNSTDKTNEIKGFKFIDMGKMSDWKDEIEEINMTMFRSYFNTMENMNEETKSSSESRETNSSPHFIDDKFKGEHINDEPRALESLNPDPISKNIKRPNENDLFTDDNAVSALDFTNSKDNRSNTTLPNRRIRDTKRIGQLLLLKTNVPASNNESSFNIQSYNIGSFLLGQNRLLWSIQKLKNKFLYLFKLLYFNIAMLMETMYGIMKEFMKNINKHNENHQQDANFLNWDHLKSYISIMRENLVTVIKDFPLLGNQKEFQGPFFSHYLYSNWDHLKSCISALNGSLISALSAYSNIISSLLFTGIAIILLILYLHLKRRIDILETEKLSELQEMRLFKAQNSSELLKSNRILYNIRRDLKAMQKFNEMALSKCKQGIDLHLKMSKTNLDNMKLVFEFVEKRMKYVIRYLGDKFRVLLDEKIKRDLSELHLMKCENNTDHNVAKENNGKGDNSTDSSSERIPPSELKSKDLNPHAVKPKQKCRTKWTNAKQISLNTTQYAEKRYSFPLDSGIQNANHHPSL